MPVPLVAGSRLSGVVAFGPANAWAVGGMKGAETQPFVPLVMHWNGHRWSLVRLPTTAPSIPDHWLTAIAGTSSRNLWAVGDSTWAENLGALFSLQRRGTRWIEGVNPTPPNEQDIDFFNDVAVLGRGNAWAVGLTAGSGGNGEVVIQHWDGSSWQSVPAPDTPTLLNSYMANLLGITALSPSDIWAVGFYELEEGTATGQPLILRWNGNEWRLAQPRHVDVPSGRLFGITSVPNRDREMWAVGQIATLYTPLILHRC